MTTKTAVKSSFVNHVEYNSTTKVLRMHLKSGLYEAGGVPEAKVAAMLAAPSVGAYWNKHIKPHHGHELVET